MMPVAVKVRYVAAILVYILKLLTLAALMQHSRYDEIWVTLSVTDHVILKSKTGANCLSGYCFQPLKQ